MALTVGLGLLIRSITTSKEPRLPESYTGPQRVAPAPPQETELVVPEGGEANAPKEQPRAPKENRSEPKEEKPLQEEPSERKRVRFRVRVTGPDFLPKAVAALEFRTPKQKNSAPYYGEKMTDDYGVYAEERSFGEFEVRALPPRWEADLGPSHWRHVKMTSEADVDIGDLVLTLPIGPSATGRLIDEEGAPIPQLEVVLKETSNHKREVATLTNKEGRFTFPGLEYGSYTISLTKGAEVETSERCFLVRRSPMPWFVVDSATPPIVELADSKLPLGGPHHHVYLHPPPDALVSTVKAIVTQGHEGSGSSVPLSVDRYGIVEWHPEEVAGHDSKHRIEVSFQRATGEDSFRAKVSVEAGKRERFLIP